MNPNTQPKRLLNLDLVKIIALFAMPFIHVFEEILVTGDLGVGGMMAADFPVQSTKMAMGILYNICPTVFMFCFGAGLALTRYNSPANYARRGIFLLTLSFILNILRYFLPFLGARLYFGPEYTEWFEEFLRSFCYSDVLYFAGFTFLIAAFCRKFRISPTLFGAVALALAVLQSFIPVPFEGKSNIINAILGNFFYTNEMSFFPLVSWLIFPVAGYHYQHYMFKANSLRNYHLITMFAGLLAAAMIYFPLLFTGNWKIEYLLWCEVGQTKMSAITITIVMPLTITWVSMFYFIAYPLSKFKRFRRHITYLSQNTTKIYFFHWVLLVWLELIPRAFEYQFRKQDVWMLICWGVIALVGACLLADLLRRWLDKRRDHLHPMFLKYISPANTNIEQNDPENPIYHVSEEDAAKEETPAVEETKPEA